MRNFARLAFCHDEIVAGHGSPGNIGRAGASPAIYAMTIVHGKRPTLQHVSCPATNASTSELHVFLSKTNFSHARATTSGVDFIAEADKK
jgi:hypothetical protein